MDSLTEQRVASLRNNLSRINNLLSEYERLLIVEENPKNAMRYKDAVTGLRTQQEGLYAEFRALINTAGTQVSEEKIADISDQLTRIDVKIEAVLATQHVTNTHLQDLKTQILKHYTESEIRIVDKLVSQMNYNDARTVEYILKALEENKVNIQEMQALSDALSSMIIDGAKRNEELRHYEELAEQAEADVRHRLKVTIPLIPILLSYEGEFEVNTGGINLRNWWRQWRGK